MKKNLTTTTPNNAKTVTFGFSMSATCGQRDKLVKGLRDIAREFDGNVSAEEIREGMNALIRETATGKEVPGGMITSRFDGTNINLSIQVKEDDMDAYINILHKTAALVAPLITAWVSISKLSNSLGSQLNELWTNFQHRFDRPHKFFVVPVQDRNTRTFAVVMMEDDGYGNVISINTRLIGENNREKAELAESLAKARRANSYGETPVFGYPTRDMAEKEVVSLETEIRRKETHFWWVSESNELSAAIAVVEDSPDRRAIRYYQQIAGTEISNEVILGRFLDGHLNVVDGEYASFEEAMAVKDAVRHQAVCMAAMRGQI